MIDNDMVRQIFARAQRRFFVDNTAFSLANREPGDALKVQGGRKYHKPIIGFAQMQQYTPLTPTATSQNVETQDEVLTVDRSTDAESIHINIDDTELAQLRDQDLEARYGDQLARAMQDSVEKRWIGKFEAMNSIGSDGSPVAFNGGNIFDVAEDALGLVDANDVSRDLQRIMLVGPREYRALERATAERESGLGDEVYVNGLKGRNFLDAVVIRSNNLPWKGTVTLGANPTAGDWIEFAGVRFTFRAVPALPGEVYIGSDATGSATNLLNAITGLAGTPGTDYIQPDITQRQMLRLNRRIRGVNTTGTLALTGFGDISVKSSFTSGSNTVTGQVKKIFFTAVGAVDLGLQLNDGLELSRPKPMTGEAHFSRISGVVLHNSKTFTDGKYMNVEVTVDASAY